MRSLRDCRPTCRRACHAAARNWAFDAVADRILTIAEIRNGAPATRALHRTEPRVSPLPDAGFAGSRPRLLAAEGSRRSAAQHDWGFIKLASSRDDRGVVVGF